MRLSSRPPNEQGPFDFSVSKNFLNVDYCQAERRLRESMKMKKFRCVADGYEKWVVVDEASNMIVADVVVHSDNLIREGRRSMVMEQLRKLIENDCE